MTRHQLRACCVFVLLLPLSPVLWADEKIPDTNAGNRLAELVRSVNDADKDELNEFLSNAFADRVEEAVERRRMQTAQVKSQLGKITVEKIVSSSDKEISASCSTSNGPNVVLTIEVTADAPHRITSISIAMGEDGPTDNSPLTTEQRGDAVERLAEELRAKYVFPKVGEEMAASVERSMEQGEYDKLDNASDFAEKLTKQLREICKDRHLRIRAGGPRRPGGQPGRRPADNHGFVKAEFLPGGIGYLKFNYFAPDDAAKKVASAAMNFLGNSKALIFDLRQNGGGSPEMIAYLSSYIFDQRVHLNSFYNRPTETTTETWTQEEVPGKKLGESIPVYVLTSAYTFSGAEEFSYNLKNMKRGTIVGEVTGGGAHPVMRVSLGKRLSMSMPYARAINPITKTNWEGVGVSQM